MSGVLLQSLGTFLNAGTNGTITATTNSSWNFLTKTAGSTMTSTINMTAGNVYIVMLGFDPSGNGTPIVNSILDTTNTYTSMTAQTQYPTTTSAGSGFMLACYITTAQSTGIKTITATLSASVSVRAMSVIELTGSTTIQRNTATVSYSPFSLNFLAPTAFDNDFVLCVMGVETNAASTPASGSTSTTRGTWSALYQNVSTGGSVLTNGGLLYQWKIITPDGTTTTQSNLWGTFGGSANYSAQSFAIQAA